MLLPVNVLYRLKGFVEVLQNVKSGQIPPDHPSVDWAIQEAQLLIDKSDKEMNGG